MKPPPKKVTIAHDEYHAKFVGWTADKRQFFSTTPFIPALEDAGREFDALYIFDPSGNLIEAQIDDLGTRAQLNIEQARELRARKIAALGEVKFRRIEIKLFQIERFGVTFGLIYHAPQKPHEARLVFVEPGNSMIFYPPFNSGEYDT